jgi:two-component system response regulator FixJ
MNKMSFNISVVDDSDIIRRTFRVMLEHAGYNVTEFASGKEFLNSGLESLADCILLDLEMPKPNGIDILNAMQDLGCKMPVIVVTGTDDAALLAAADCDMVSTILKKPIGPDALLAAVAEVLRQPSRTG